GRGPDIAVLTYDVAVVGGGPAGAAAARAAALAGASTVLLEREQLPRYKRCGGGLIGLSQQAVRDAGLDLAAIQRDQVGRVTFTLRGGRPFTRSAPPFLPMVHRAEFDAALTDRAVQAGATLRTGVTVSGYAEADGVVTLGTSDGPLLARAVVAADGSQGRAAAYVGVVCDQVDIGLEAELPTPPGSDWAGRALLDWGPVPGSYGWVFPKGDTLTVGVIGDRTQGAAMRDYYRSFVASLGLDLADAQHDGGHLTRVRAPGSPVRRGRVLVAGDAAGLLEPYTREGISYALRSGALAGAAAAGDHAAYDPAIETALQPDVAAGSAALAAFVRAPAVVHLAFRHPRAWRLFVRVAGGRTTLAEQLDRRTVRAAVTLLARTPRVGRRRARRAPEPVDARTDRGSRTS
ncbi:MAG: geranylgeranyl reductase, partial [Frankiales bacterium]|nr:geranylgeranyl reductase [Frankiales bacterium]